MDDHLKLFLEFAKQYVAWQEAKEGNAPRDDCETPITPICEDNCGHCELCINKKDDDDY